MKVVLDWNSASVLMKPINGSGGFQDLLRRLQSNSKMSVTVDIPEEDIRKLRRYAKRYGDGGFQGRLLRILDGRQS